MARDVQALALALGEAFAASSVPESLRADMRLHLASAESVRYVESELPGRAWGLFLALPTTEFVCCNVQAVLLNYIKVCQDVVP